MSVLVWIVVGLIVGVSLASASTGLGDTLLPDVGVAVVGAVAGGGLCTALAGAWGAGLNLYALLAAMAGSTLALVAFNLIPRQAEKGTNPVEGQGSAEVPRIG